MNIVAASHTKQHKGTAQPCWLGSMEPSEGGGGTVTCETLPHTPAKENSLSLSNLYEINNANKSHCKAQVTAVFLQQQRKKLQFSL